MALHPFSNTHIPPFTKLCRLWVQRHAKHPSMKKLFAFLLLTTPALADDATIEAATAQSSGGDWTFSVTLRHADTGWDDYADGWRVVLEDGTVLGTRVLFHPHVNEQPFTRTLGGVEIPAGTMQVFIEASTLPDGWGKARLAVSLK